MFIVQVTGGLGNLPVISLNCQKDIQNSDKARRRSRKVTYTREAFSRVALIREAF